MGRNDVSPAELLERATANGYKQGAHQDEDSKRESTKYIKKTLRNQDIALRRYKKWVQTSTWFSILQDIYLPNWADGGLLLRRRSRARENHFSVTMPRLMFPILWGHGVFKKVYLLLILSPLRTSFALSSPPAEESLTTDRKRLPWIPQTLLRSGSLLDLLERQVTVSMGKTDVRYTK